MAEPADFTSFLFGNVDEEGNLESDFLDEETKAQLANLSCFLSGAGGDDAFQGDRIDNRADEFASHDDDESDASSRPESKASSAVDFAEIDELAGDDAAVEQNDCEDDDDEIGDDVDAVDNEFSECLDSSDSSEDEPPSDGDLEKPLASMLPDGLRDTNVRRYFPEFREGKVLRFSRLFGPGKPTSLPQIWRGVKSRRKPPHAAATQRSKSVEEPPPPPADAPSTSGAERSKGFELDFAPTPTAEECETDDELRLMKPEEPSKKIIRRGSTQNDKSDPTNIAPWRFGPAAYWYDILGVPANGDGFDFGFKLKKKENNNNEETSPDQQQKPKDMFPPDAYYPITCTRWEDDIIYDGEDVREDVAKKYASGRQPICGWIPTQQTRTYESFVAMLKSGGFAQMFGGGGKVSPHPQPFAGGSLDTSNPGPNFCIFPPDNEELISGRWLLDVIIDPDKMEHIPEPKILTLDPSEDQMLFGIPEDVAKEQDSIQGDDSGLNKSSDRKDHQFTKKSQMILGKVAQRQREEEEEAASQMVEKDPYNLSNDEYYLPKGTSPVTTFGGSMIQHSIPAQNLMPPFFPTYLSVAKLRHFHRWPLKRYVARGPLSRPGYHTVQSLEKHIQKKDKARDQQRLAFGGGEMFFMREAEDLSGKDGELIFCEYSEEHPPLIMQPGMATKIKNFYKRKPGKDNTEPQYEYGETAYTHTLPFLGTLMPGESLQALDNSLFRAPIYQHKVPETDFLVIRTRHGYYIRPINTIFAVGQECPCYEVPSPNSKRASNFVRDYLLVYIYRLFWASRNEPRRLRMEDIRTHAFPHYAESTIRKRLKLCSDFKRLGPGTEANFWVLREDFRLPSKEEIRALVTPETCCAFFSMLAAEQRLKDAGYGEKYFFTPEDEDDDNDQAKMADEVKCAPWNTTRAFISAMKGKCLLDFTGVADPTGCGEGYSYVKVSAKPPKEEVPPPIKRTVTGTDADLRKLSLKDAKQLLRDFGVKDDEIKTLTRWEIIDVIRTLSTQQARSGGTGITKFARGSMRFSMAEVQERYKLDCQRIFDLQNKVLNSTDVVSTDEDESEAEDSDIEEMGKNIETMLTNKRTAMNAEEHQRTLEDGGGAGATSPTDGGGARHPPHHQKEKPTASVAGPSSGTMANDENERERKRELISSMTSGRKLKIYRTFRHPDGRQPDVRVEVVTRPELIEAYVRIRTTKDEAFIKHFAQMDEQYKEEKRREKRRLQDQLRRIRRNELKMAMKEKGGRGGDDDDGDSGAPSSSHFHHKFGGGSSYSKHHHHHSMKSDKPKKPPPPPKPSLLKMRCSACGGNGHMKTNKNCPLYGKVKLPRQQVAMTDEQIEEEVRLPTSAENLVSVEGTKLKLSKVVVEHAENMKKKSLKLVFPRHVVTAAAGGSSTTVSSATAAAAASMMHHAAVDLESMANEMRSSAYSPTTSTTTNFMDDTEDAAGGGEFSQRPSLVMKIANPKIYKEKRQHAEYLKEVPRPSVHRRRVDPRVAMSVVMEGILNELKALPEALHFIQSVNKKKVPDYYRIVERPMDLQKIRMNITKNQYMTREEFLKDVRQMLDNSRLYNGDQHEITQAARVLFEHASRRVAEREQRLMKLEKGINPLLDDNDQVAFSYILGSIIQRCKNVPKSVPFHAPVDAKKVKTYYEKIARPMDLGTMELKCKGHYYHTVAAFERDLELIYKNSVTFNGESSTFTMKAKEIYDVGKAELDERRQQLADLERTLEATKERALEDAETDSLVTATSSVAGDFAADPRLDEFLVVESPTAAPPDENSNSQLLQQDLQLSEGEEEEDADDDVFVRKASAAATDFRSLQREERAASKTSATMVGEEAAEEQRLAEELEEGELEEDAQQQQQTAGGANEEQIDEDEEDEDDDGSRPAGRWRNETNIAELLDKSEMVRTGRLHTDLAMSDSSASDQDDEDDDDDGGGEGRAGGPTPAKRARTYSKDECDFGTL